MRFTLSLLLLIALSVSSISRAADTSSDSVGQLKTVKVEADAEETSENTGSFAAEKSRGASRLTLNLKETPQSVSVITREQMDVRGLSTLEDILAATPGVYTTRLDSERSAYYSRGFAITSRQIDGLPVGDNSPRFDNFFFDRVEVIKGATGLMGAHWQSFRHH